ncbi:MAG: hypothetical protein ACRYGP_22435 [Janthinobacterium lividum]
MAILQKLSDGEIKALADRVLGPEMVDLGFSGVDVDHRDIFEDGPSLYIGLRVRGDVAAPFDPDRFNRFRRVFRDALLDQGDERFPHMVLKREGDEQPEPDHIPVDP